MLKRTLAILMLISCTAAGRIPQEAQGPGWPREIETANLKITLYEPQLESLHGTRLITRAALSVSDGTEPVFGALWLETILAIDADRRTAKPESLLIKELRLPGADSNRTAEVRDAVSLELARGNPVYSMDALHEELRQLEERKAAAQGLKAEVPDILFRTHPAVLLTIDGEPEWRQVPGNRCRRLANSAFFVIEEPDGGRCWLRISPFWWTAASPLGPWLAADEPSGTVAELWKNEPKPQIQSAEEDPVRPEVIPVTRPSELIWTDGAPQFAPIAGTDLLYVKNTASDVFMEISTQTSYVLLSGRWYRTSGSKVAWEFVPSDQLPADFSRIPLSSEKQHVLACVAGTAQAREALKNAQIPQTEAVKPGAAPDAAPVFDGEPQFADIPQCSVRYAVNTPCPIFLVDRRYYWCQEGIWYDSDYAVGPWFVCSWVPGPIYLIPPSCPFYYVTFCRIFSVSARAIYVGYYPGYRGCYAWGGSVVYGTGWSYRRWSGNVCYSRPLTWGACVRYSPAVCNWTLRVGTGSSCAWTGVGYSTGWRAPTLSVGVGGSVGLYRAGHAAPAPTPVTMHKPDNLYSRQPDRILRPVAPETSRSKSFGERGAEVPRSPAARTPVPPPHHDGTRTPAPTAPSTPDHREAPRASREIPRTPAPDGEAPKAPPPDHREGPKSSREIPRAPAPDREAPKPPPVERRDPPKAPPSPPPPVERRDPPRNPPPPPPPVERRAPPPPPPPPVERRSPPPPPPPPPQRDPDRRR